MRIVSVSLVVLVLSFAGCGKQPAPNAPGDASVSPLRAGLAVTPFAQSKLDGLWPNDDGHSWSFAYKYEQDFSTQPQVYATPEQVPPAPSPEGVLPALRTAVTLGDTQNGSYGLVFQGQTTTQSGATGQNLVESLTDPTAGPSAALTPTLEQRLMNRVGWVRPDLRGKIAALGVSTRKLDTFPILVHGGAWQKTLQYIGTFGDLDQNLAWKFLDANTKQGATFHFQLLASLTNDVFLDAWVVPNKLRTDKGGKSIEVVYVIDYGVTEVTDQTGASIGFARSIGYGSVTYQPGVGPVSVLERTIAPVEHPEHPNVQITLSPGSFVVGTP